ncbi:MAG TPA: nucleotide sugar dehydrogenase [Candidatus Bathyarchaeia archaeon]|nr:nucleotide sugar dehydrogenase [Candidatus Bathyarchaeia archaeon]
MKDIETKESEPISVIGTGYVGLSLAVLLARNHNVTSLDIDPARIDLINERRSPIADRDIEEFLGDKALSLTATLDREAAYQNAEYIIIATPTNYDPETKYFDTSLVETVLEEALEFNPQATAVIKSTVPVGFTKKMRAQFKSERILFSPEFLREGKALHDNLYPSRIIVGDTTREAKRFAKILANAALSKDVPVILTQPSEAEAIKLFANTYLAMRVAYFNEIDTYAEVHDLDTGQIIKGVSLDPRIGDYYNNPSFGYGGYCLPKDTKQLLANYQDIPNDLIGAIVDSNQTRMEFIANSILRREPKTVGIYRLTMKTDSDNFRDSSIQGVISHLRRANVEVVIYEPTITTDAFDSNRVVSDLSEFKNMVDIIVANRMSSELYDVGNKLYTRDVYSRD